MHFQDVPLVGSYFRGKDVANLVATFQPGQRFELAREPDNTHDSYAIKVLHEGIHIGYIAAQKAAWIAPHMDEGTEFFAILTSMQVNGKGKPEPWLSLCDDEGDLETIAEVVSRFAYTVGEDPLDQPVGALSDQPLHQDDLP